MCKIQTRLAAKGGNPIAALALSLMVWDLILSLTAFSEGGASSLAVRFLRAVAVRRAKFLASRRALCLPSTSAW